MTPEVPQRRSNVRIHGVTSVLGYLHPIETPGDLLAAVCIGGPHPQEVASRTVGQIQEV